MSCSVGGREQVQETCEALSMFFKTDIVLDQCMDTLLDRLSENSQFSLNLFEHECLALHRKERAKVKQVLKHVDGNISLSVDFLSSGNADNKNGSVYICLTAHFIDHKWTLRRFVLDFSPLQGEGKDFPSDIVLKSLRNWEIEDKILTITMVNGSLCDEIFEAFRNKFWSATLNGTPYRVKCCADIVKTIVKDAYESIGEILDKIEDVYPFDNPLPTWKNKCNHLKLDVLTKELGSFAGIRYDEKPSENDWSKVSDVCELVDKVYDLVFPLFGKEFQSANLFLCDLLEVHLYLNLTAYLSNSFKKGVAKKMMQTLDEYVTKMYFLLVTPSVMDPRLKMKYIGFSSYRLQGSNNDPQILMTTSEAISNLYDKYVARYPIKEDVSGDGVPMLMQEFTRYIQNNTSKAVKKSELVRYLNEPVLTWSSDFNVLTWWKVEGSSKYPTLSRMARDVLAIPFTVAVGENALLIEQRRVDSCLASVDPGMANVYMRIRSWLSNQNSVLSSSSSS